MTIPPANIPEQGWAYPPAHPPAGHSAQAQVGGFYTRGYDLSVPQNPTRTQAIWVEKKPLRRGRKIAAATLGALGILIIMFFALIESGLSGTFVGFISALIPLAVVLSAIAWLDRWEPEPRLYLLLSFVWGAGVATVAAMVINTRAFSTLIESGMDPVSVELLGTGVVAPISEELLKGVALLAIVLWRSRLIDSPVDLVVYAATIAGGFAFTENILYFARGSSQGMLGTVFFGRAIMSPFAHIMFTSATALILALVLYSKRNRLLWAFPLGVTLAVILHAAWNITAIVAGEAFFTVFFFLHVPIFVAFVLTLVLLRRREQRNIVTNLAKYAQSGWFAPHEVDMLGSLALRSQARTWAANYGVRAAQEMTQFQTTATRLALNRRAMTHASRKNKPRLDSLVHIEGGLLEELHTHRSRFLEISGPIASQPQGAR